MQEAYKLLAQQLGISNNKAKSLIDSGFVSYAGKRILIARARLSKDAKLTVNDNVKPSRVYEDDELLVLNKPEGLGSEALEEPGLKLINRLDRDSSGLVLLAKTQECFAKALLSFKNQEAKRYYIALCSGILSEELLIEDAIKTTKGHSAFSKISKEGLPAISLVTPLLVSGKKSAVMVQIKTGRTHQIRVHLNAYKHGILGDVKYSKIPASRLFLHAFCYELFGQRFFAPLPKSFKEGAKRFSFDLNLDLKALP